MNTSRFTGLFLLAGLICILRAACSPATVKSPSPAGTPAGLALSTQVAGLVTQPGDMVGIWQVFDTHCPKGFMLIRPDGTYTFSCSRDGSAGDTGTYWFENRNFMIKNDFCGATGQYTAQIFRGNGQPKTLVFTVIKDDCEMEIGALTQQKAVWVAALP
jgi:hypothetical protein